MDKNLLTCFVLERDLAPWKSFQMMGALRGGSASYACQKKKACQGFIVVDGVRTRIGS